MQSEDIQHATGEIQVDVKNNPQKGNDEMEQTESKSEVLACKQRQTPPTENTETAEVKMQSEDIQHATEETKDNGKSNPPKNNGEMDQTESNEEVLACNQRQTPPKETDVSNKTQHEADEVFTFLEKLGLEKYSAKLQKEDVSMEILSSMTPDDFKGIGITIGHSIKIRKALEMSLKTDDNQKHETGKSIDKKGTDERTFVDGSVDDKSSSSVREKIRVFNQHKDPPLQVSAPAKKGKENKELESKAKITEEERTYDTVSHDASEDGSDEIPPSVREKAIALNKMKSLPISLSQNPEEEKDQTTKLRLILIGKTGTGKSATANTILGGPYFPTSSSGSSITERCSSECATRFGRIIQVIDTPGLFDTSLTREETEEELLKCIAMSAPGPHAFILVLNIARFTTEEEETAMRFFDLFENAVFDYFIVLFTRLDDLEYERKTLAEHLQSAPENLESILTKCHGRYIAFNNRETGAKKDKQVQKLLEIIDKNMLGRQTRYYTDEMFQEAERLLRAKEEEIRRDLEHQKEKKYESLRREIEAKYKNQQENLRFRMKKIDEQYQTIEDKIASRKTEIAEFINKKKDETAMINKKKEETAIIENEAKEIERRKNIELQDLRDRQIEDKIPVESLRVSIIQSFKDEGTKLSNLIKSSAPVKAMKRFISKFF